MLFNHTLTFNYKDVIKLRQMDKTHLILTALASSFSLCLAINAFVMRSHMLSRLDKLGLYLYPCKDTEPVRDIVKEIQSSGEEQCF